jgi:hypothetical protein
MIAPVLNMVTGSTSWAGVVMPKMPVPPRFTAPALLDPPPPLELAPPPPQAARIAASAGTEAPITLARTRSC